MNATLLKLASLACLACVLGVPSGSAKADRAPFENALAPDQGKLPLTAGFNDIDGAGGGGLVPWALISGYGTSDSWGANAHYTAVQLRDFRLRSYGVAVGALDRVEASVASNTFDVTAVGLNGLSVAVKVFALKLRLFGDAIYGQDSWVPQTAVGVEYKRNTGFSNGVAAGHALLIRPTQLGATADSGTDLYLTSTKVFLAQSLLFTANARYSKADQFGLLGFGGDRNDHRALNAEATLAYIVTRTVAVGAEYRGRSHHLSVDDERGAWDAFAAWAPTRHVSLVAAIVSLGSILAPITRQSRDQTGAYISLQVGF